ncbi:MAG: hypothetical protein ACJ8FY_22995 [Gemmataceae bacterium]
MILNSYAVLDGFITSLRLGLGLLILFVGFTACRTWFSRRTLSEKHQSIDAPLHLLYQLAVLLLVLNVVSWPIFYLMLLSYVPEWPGVMCIYGVMQIGTGSEGTARFLPILLQCLQATKPLLVFLSGAWFVLHLLNRRTRTASLTNLVLAFIMGAALMSLSDGVAELAYLAIPKKEEFAAAGCCTTILRESTDSFRFLPRVYLGEYPDSLFYAAYYGINSFMVLGLGWVVFWARRSFVQSSLGILLSAGLISALVNWLFLGRVAAPILLHMPNHNCPYDLISEAPGSIVSFVFFVGGFYCLGWAGVARWLGMCHETKSFMNESIHRLLLLGLLGYLGSLVIMTVELALA